MGSTHSDEAAKLLSAACAVRFPTVTDVSDRAAPSTRVLSLFYETAKIGGWGGVRPAPALTPSWNGELYNPLDSVTITEVVFSITYVIGTDTTRLPYRQTVTIPPLSVATISFDILRQSNDETDYSFTITRARGRRFVR